MEYRKRLSRFCEMTVTEVPDEPAPDRASEAQCRQIMEREGERLLKAILAGHLHITVQDRFSPTAMQYVVGSNYGFVGQEVIFT